MSRQKYNLLLLLVCGLVGVAVGDWDHDIDTIINNINKGRTEGFSNSMKLLETAPETYDINADKIVPVDDLKAAMAELHVQQDKYSGQITKDLLDVQLTSDLLMNDYRLSTDEMFRWAVMAKQRFNFFDQYRDKLTNMHSVEELTEEILNNGKSTVKQTVDDYSRVDQSLGKLQDKLREMKTTLDQELASHNRKFDEYERKRTESNEKLKSDLEAAEERLKECEKRKEKALKKKPPVVISCASEVVEKTKLSLQKELPSKEGDREMLRGFFGDMGQALLNGVQSASACQRKIKKEVNYVEDLKDKATQLESNKSDGKAMRQLTSDLDNYVKRHSGHSEFTF